MDILKGCKPELIFDYFEKISLIPRKSGFNTEIASYVFNEAKRLSYEPKMDEYENVVVCVPGTEGYENHDVVMLQGHLDMVPAVETGFTHDFTKDPLDIYVEGDWIGAHHTTLGGDDGAAVVFMLALLADKTIPHPPLECVFTTDEEIGLIGCANLDFSFSKAKYLINMDSEDEGIFTVSCAGGVRVDNTFIRKNALASGHKTEITIFSTFGGHSGAEIHKGRPNTNKVCGTFLRDLTNDFPEIKIQSIEGGTLDNAICCLTKVVLVSPVELDVSKYDQIFREEYATTDVVLSISTKDLGLCADELVWDDDTQSNVLNYIALMPNGVVSMNHQVEGLVETSLNCGIIKTLADTITVCQSVRSSIESRKNHVVDDLKNLSIMCHGEQTLRGDYPGWPMKTDSKLTALAVQIWNNQYEKETGVHGRAEGIHAGLECGFISNAIPNIDIISMGPNMRDIHTFKERLSISSTARCFKFLCDILKEI